MRKICLFYLLLTKICVSVCVAQTEDLFNWSNGNVVEKEHFLKINHQPNPDLQTYEESETFLRHSFTLFSPNDKYKCYIQFRGEGEGNRDNECSLFTIVDENGSQLFLRDGFESSIITVGDLTMNGLKENNWFLQVPLDDNSYALFITCYFYGYDLSRPGEMMIIVVNKNIATLVYDDRALAFSYTPAPNFAIEFVSDATGLYNENIDDIEFSPSRLVSHTKHKIWREGNMLKYKTWK